MNISSSSGQTPEIAQSKSPKNNSQREDLESDVDQQIINLEEQHDGLDNKSSLNMSMGRKIGKKLGKSMTKRKQVLKEVETIPENFSNENLRTSRLSEQKPSKKGPKMF